MRRGELFRIKKGWFSIHDDPLVSVFSFRPGYIGLQEALSLHDLWDQETNVVVVTTRRVRTGVREVGGSNVVLHTMIRKYFFGYEYQRYGELFIPVSDVEKTLIDLLYFNEVPDKDVLKEIRGRADKKKLQLYLNRYSPRVRKRMLARLS